MIVLSITNDLTTSFPMTLTSFIIHSTDNTLIQSTVMSGETYRNRYVIISEFLRSNLLVIEKL